MHRRSDSGRSFLFCGNMKDVKFLADTLTLLPSHLDLS